MQHDFILLDRTGSMINKWTETLGAVNAYVGDLAKQGLDTGVTLAVFDAPNNNIDFSVIRDRITPATWKPVNSDEVSPRGYTPLNDAVGKITALAKEGINGQQYDKVAFIVFTDGIENASLEYTHEQAKASIAECKARGWEFVFIGCDFDNTQQAAAFGVASAATLTGASPEKMGMAAQATGRARGAYSSGGKFEYTDAEKESVKK